MLSFYRAPRHCSGNESGFANIACSTGIAKPIAVAFPDFVKIVDFIRYRYRKKLLTTRPLSIPNSEIALIEMRHERTMGNLMALYFLNATTATFFVFIRYHYIRRYIYDEYLLGRSSTVDMNA